MTTEQLIAQIDFYVLDSSDQQRTWRLAAKLAEKARAQQQTMAISLNDATTSAQFDDFLWYYQDIGFLPHELWQADTALTTGLYLGYQNPPKADILVNLSTEIPDNYQQFKRLIEIVDQRPERKLACRQHYQFYKQQGYTVKSHTI